jgi:hypothetical protein
VGFNKLRVNTLEEVRFFFLFRSCTPHFRDQKEHPLKKLTMIDDVDDNDDDESS